MITKFDTKEVEQVARDLKQLADDYTALITAFFKRMGEVTTITKEWVGNQADFYFNKVFQDKSMYIDFGIMLKNIPIKLDNDLNDISTYITKSTKREEEVKNYDQIHVSE